MYYLMDAYAMAMEEMSGEVAVMEAMVRASLLPFIWAEMWPEVYTRVQAKVRAEVEAYGDIELLRRFMRMFPPITDDPSTREIVENFADRVKAKWEANERQKSAGV
jgi:hypothetical protein